MTDLTGQIGLVCEPTSFWPWLIATVTRSPVYHTVVAIDNVRCVSAEPGGARLREISRYKHIVFSRFELTEEQRDDIVDWALAHLDVPYGFFSDIAIFLGLKLGLKTPKWIARYLSTDQVMMCSQLCDSAYAENGVHIFTDGRLPSAVWPGSYVPLWKRRGWWKE